jgi:hypothetical protein
MATPIDTMKLITDMRDAASQTVGKDIGSLRGFSERQLEAIARQAAFVSEGIANGEITTATRDFFLDSLEEMALSFAKTLRGLMAVTVEKVWNAVVGVLWSAIELATGLKLVI